MNRTGLIIALVVAVVVGVPFAIYPQFDLSISNLFVDPTTRTFIFELREWAERCRSAALWLVALFPLLCGCAIIAKIIWPLRPMLIPGRAVVFLLITLTLGPGILANTILKDHWGRARPLDVMQHRTDPFSPWWDFRAQCRGNCSFIAGEPSGAFWTLAPAALAPPQWRVLAYAGALVFGTSVGLLRIGGGGHFFTDVVFAGVFMYLVVWTIHGFLYRWQATRISDDAIERPLTQLGQSIRKLFAAK